MGSNHSALFARRDDSRIKSYDVSTLDGMTIGGYQAASEKIRLLQEFLTFHDISCELVYYSHDDMVDGSFYYYLASGDVDLLLGSDIDADSTYRPVAEFESQPYYLVTNTDSQEILDGLNMAMTQILDANPDFPRERYAANLAFTPNPTILFNADELAYIKEHSRIQVAAVSGWHPFYCVSEEAGHDGIVPDLFKLIEERTGLQFTLVYADTYADAIAMVQNGEADILGCFLDAEEEAAEMELALTAPYAYLNNIVVKNNAVRYPSDNLTGAVLQGRPVPANMDSSAVREYSTMLDGIKAVNRGEVDFLYGLSATLEYHMQHHTFQNVSALSINNSSSVASMICFFSGQAELSYSWTSMATFVLSSAHFQNHCSFQEPEISLLRMAMVMETGSVVTGNWLSRFRIPPLSSGADEPAGPGDTPESLTPPP